MSDVNGINTFATEQLNKRTEERKRAIELATYLNVVIPGDISQWMWSLPILEVMAKMMKDHDLQLANVLAILEGMHTRVVCAEERLAHISVLMAQMNEIKIIR